MRAKVWGHLRTHVVGYLALSVALSGTAYAVETSSINARELAPNSVGASELQPNSVASDSLRDGSVSSEHFTPGTCQGFVGQLILVPFNQYVPDGTVAANGQLLSIYDPNTQALAGLFGYTYGGSEASGQFGVPKLEPPNPNMQYVLCVDGNYPTD